MLDPLLAEDKQISEQGPSTGRAHLLSVQQKSSFISTGASMGSSLADEWRTQGKRGS